MYKRQGLAQKLRAHKGTLALFHLLVDGGLAIGQALAPGDAVIDLSGGEQQGAEGQFLDGVGVGAGGIEDHDAGLGAAVRGDVVGAGAGAANG